MSLTLHENYTIALRLNLCSFWCKVWQSGIKTASIKGFRGYRYKYIPCRRIKRSNLVKISYCYAMKYAAPPLTCSNRKITFSAGKIELRRAASYETAPPEKNPKVLSIYGLNLDRVGIACRTVDESACHYDVVTCFKAEDVLCYIEAVVVHNVS